MGNKTVMEGTGLDEGMDDQREPEGRYLSIVPSTQLRQRLSF